MDRGSVRAVAILAQSGALRHGSISTYSNGVGDARKGPIIGDDRWIRSVDGWVDGFSCMVLVYAPLLE